MPNSIDSTENKVNRLCKLFNVLSLDQIASLIRLNDCLEITEQKIKFLNEELKKEKEVYNSIIGLIHETKKDK